MAELSDPSEIVAGLSPIEGRRLYGQDPTAYDAGRPEYPERVWALLEERCHLVRGSRVVEIGPGTGLATRRLVSMGVNVTGIEPNASMAAYLQRTLDSDQARIVVAPFEDAQLEGRSFDLAVAATSFHWLDQRTASAKLRRVVRSDGWIAIWWMLFEDPTRRDDFADAAESLLGGSPSSILEPAQRPFQIDEVKRRSDLRNAGFADVESELIRSELDMDATQVRALYATMAIVLRRPQHEQRQALDAIEALVHRNYGGRVTRTFLTALYTARNP
ncbi:MAG: class I SAM-dependent methyltransferase [Actinomycetota bacterium]|nr:class I SAM-dependent methyltransferase [Actinomycetota bacterium]